MEVLHQHWHFHIQDSLQTLLPVVVLSLSTVNVISNSWRLKSVEIWSLLIMVELEFCAQTQRCHSIKPHFQTIESQPELKTKSPVQNFHPTQLAKLHRKMENGIQLVHQQIQAAMQEKHLIGFGIWLQEDVLFSDWRVFAFVLLVIGGLCEKSFFICFFVVCFVLTTIVFSFLKQTLDGKEIRKPKQNIKCLTKSNMKRDMKSQILFQLKKTTINNNFLFVRYCMIKIKF